MVTKERQTKEETVIKERAEVVDEKETVVKKEKALPISCREWSVRVSQRKSNL